MCVRVYSMLAYVCMYMYVHYYNYYSSTLIIYIAQVCVCIHVVTCIIMRVCWACVLGMCVYSIACRLILCGSSHFTLPRPLYPCGNC